jgi:hypothetical protein
VVIPTDYLPLMTLGKEAAGQVLRQGLIMLKNAIVKKAKALKVAIIF